MTDAAAILDTRQLDIVRGNKIKAADRVTLPKLKYWNYDPCSHHETPQVDCEFRQCGGDFFDHQTKSIAYHFLMRKTMEASVPGAGKTNIVLGLLALLKERGMLTKRAVVICQTPAALQWFEEAARWTPKLQTEVVYGKLDRRKRIDRYVRNWDVLITGFHIMLRDVDLLEKLEIGFVITDDVDPLLDHTNDTHQKIVHLAERADRAMVINATNIQTRLTQLHAACRPIDGDRIWGSLTAFERRYVKTQPVVMWDSRTGRKHKSIKMVGYKNMNELKEKLAPLVIRHRYEDLKDVKMPTVMPPENIWLDLSALQRAKYQELQQGVITLLRDEPVVKHASAMAKFMYGQEICAGLPALGEPDGPGASVKLDWLMQQLFGSWEDQKIIVFMKNLGMVSALQKRLEASKIGYATIWGNDRDAVRRRDEQTRFWNDPKCRVFMGTSAIERSLNLQVSNIVVCVDTHLNPARMKQIVGRARRAGSPHEHLYVFNLFCRDTQEENYLPVLEARQALADWVWEESSELYQALSPLQLLELIKP